MPIHKLYLQQTNFNGISYTKGAVADVHTDFGIICRDFPFKLYSETKDVVTKQWRGSHGLDVYIPTVARIKDYEIDVVFLYVGTHATMRQHIDNFIKYLAGFKNKSGGTADGARLAVYDTYTQIGRKDVRFVKVDFGTWWDEPTFDTDAIADFTVKFHVYDPVTEVSTTTSQGVVTDLTWT